MERVYRLGNGFLVLFWGILVLGRQTNGFLGAGAGQGGAQGSCAGTWAAGHTHSGQYLYNLGVVAKPLSGLQVTTKRQYIARVSAIPKSISA